MGLPKSDYSCHVTSINGIGTCFLITEGPNLLVIRKKEDDTNCIIQDLLELQNIEVALSQGEPSILLTKAGSFQFDSENEAEATKEWIEKAKQDVRFQKLKQLYLLLGIESNDALSISRRKSKPLMGDVLKPSPLSDSEDNLDSNMLEEDEKIDSETEKSESEKSESDKQESSEKLETKPESESGENEE